MTLPSSGTIKMSQVRDELKKTGPISLGNADVRKLGGKPSGTIKMSDLYGKSAEIKHSCVFRWIPPWNDYKTYEIRADVPDGKLVSDYVYIDFEQVKKDMGWPSRFANYDTCTIYDINGKVLSDMFEGSEIKQPIIYENMLDADPFGYEFMIEGTTIEKGDTFFTNDEYIVFSGVNDFFYNAYTFWYPEDDTYLIEDLHNTHRIMTGKASVVSNDGTNTPITFPYKMNEVEKFIIHTVINDDKVAYGSLETSEDVDYGPDGDYAHYVYNMSFKNSNSTPNYYAYCNFTDSPYGEVYPPTLYVNQIKESSNWIKSMKYATISVIVSDGGGYAEKIELISATLKSVSGDRAQYSITSNWDYAYDYPVDFEYVLTSGPNGNYRKFTKAELSFHN